MLLAELTAYAKEKYQMEEQHKWADFPGFSVLCHPQTGKWVALLMRQWDADTGSEIERCDLKCGGDCLLREQRPYLSPPIRMRGGQWIDVAFDSRTESALVFRLFDRAVEAGTPRGFTIVLASQLPEGGSCYRETALPFTSSAYRAEKDAVPARLREMRRLYEYGRETPAARARNFYRQAVFMCDYEDDQPWEGDFVCFFPTYHDLNTRQLRGYFNWRARLRRGDAQPIPVSAAYLYVYELLNGVGSQTPAESLEKLLAFERLFVDTGLGDARMKSNLRRWMGEYAVLHDLPPALARQYADPALIDEDLALAALREPESHTDEEICAALCRFGGKKTENSPVLSADPARGRALLAQCWRAASVCRRQEKDLFTLCFGEKKSRPWYPLANAVIYERARPTDRDYVLDACRSFHCRGGVWHTEAYDKAAIDRPLLQSFLHAADARLRRYLKAGRALRENPAGAWAIPVIEGVIEADRKALLAAAVPRVTIDLAGLEQIRRDAAVTRESLLTEDELGEAEEAAPPAAEAGAPDDLPLDATARRVLYALLAGQDAAAICREARRMPSVIADAINEALFDVFGDTVVLCEDDRLLLVDDYAEELEEYLGGNSHGGT